MSFDNFPLRNFEPVTARHINALAAAVERDARPGRNIRQRVFPFGTINNYDGGSGGGTSPIFAPNVTREKDGFRVGFELGLIAGVEPSIGGVGISKKTEEGKRPTLFIPRELVDPIHGIGVYFRVTYSRDWQATFAEPIASVEAPRQQSWTFHKLACIVFADGSVFRAMYFNLGVEVYNQGPDGIARFAPHAQ